jgi:hypothetical protein
MLKKQTKSELLGIIQLTMNSNHYNYRTAGRLSEIYLEVQRLDSEAPQSRRLATILLMVICGLSGVVFGYVVSTIERLFN